MNVISKLSFLLLYFCKHASALYNKIYLPACHLCNLNCKATICLWKWKTLGVIDLESHWNSILVLSSNCTRLLNWWYTTSVLCSGLSQVHRLQKAIRLIMQNWHYWQDTTKQTCLNRCLSELKGHTSFYLFLYLEWLWSSSICKHQHLYYHLVCYFN